MQNSHNRKNAIKNACEACISWDNDKKRIACAILAGGENKRMGRHKAFLTCHGIKFIDIIGDNMKAFFDEVFIVSNDKSLFKEMPLAIFEDIIPGKGPLGALHTALTVSKKEYIFCVACDMPETYDSVIAEVICASKKQGFDCFVPRGEFGLEPLFAIYRKSMRGLIEKEIAVGQLCIFKILEKCRTFYVDMAKHENELVNINTPQEYIDYADKIEGMAFEK
ncbi:MAG: molybdenum cofactor guanylyltransferase [Candidatus Omnitrophica bacterium]|nr:molybdenum cofactor guanylyltransferase [Candidatus Omnitrophota bacterium]